MPITAFAAPRAKAALEKFSYEPKPLGSFDIEVKITHCGICHSDVHLIDNDWGVSSYPLVPGHEIIGVVTQTGSDVRQLKKGDRVGIGWQQSACLECDYCVSGNENFCPNRGATCVANHGGFAETIRTDSRFAFLIPESLPSESAAPLLCAGATVYTPLEHFDVRPHHRVGVVGIGGLGHLAIRFATAFGCEVTAFSTSPDKEKEAKSFGATRFVVSSDAKAMAAAADSLDLILSTVFSAMDWVPYLKTLRLDGTLCLLGAAEKPMEIPAGLLMSGRRRITSSVIGSRATIRNMLDFAARHGIRAQTEVMPLAEVNAAIAKVRHNKARYRMVLRTNS